MKHFTQILSLLIFTSLPMTVFAFGGGSSTPSTPTPAPSYGITNYTYTNSVSNRSAENEFGYLWKGFDHEWKRTVVGFRIPHRVSSFKNVIENENSTGSGWDSTAKFRFGQSTGVDGNFMYPKGYYGVVQSPNIYVTRGTAKMTWTDTVNKATHPVAKSDISQIVTISLNNAQQDYGRLNQYTAVLRGINLDLHCDNAKQPSNKPCNSDGMWPYKFYVSLNNCYRSSTNLKCTLKVNIHRAWTPIKGGLALGTWQIEEKPLNDKLDFSLDVAYTVVGGNHGDFRYTVGSQFTRSGMVHDNSPKSGTKTLYGQSGYARGTIGITAFGYQLSKPDSIPFWQIISNADTGHLGRYFDQWNFKVQDGTYNASSRAMSYTYALKVHSPDTVVNSKITYQMRNVLLQFGSSAQVKSKQSASGVICRKNSDQAPFFSKWDKCTEAGTSPKAKDKGPEQTEDTVTIHN